MDELENQRKINLKNSRVEKKENLNNKSANEIDEVEKLLKQYELRKEMRQKYESKIKNLPRNAEFEKDYTPEHEGGDAVKNIEEKRRIKLEEKRNNDEKNHDSGYENFKEIYGEEISEADVNDIIIKKPTIPNFPYFIFSLAVFKDIVDIALILIQNGTLAIPFGGIVLSVFFIAVGWFWSILIYIIIFIWMFSKSTYIRKHIIKKMFLPLILLPLSGLIPEINVFPESAITVYLIYKSEYGITKKIIDTLEKYEKGIERIKSFM